VRFSSIALMCSLIHLPATNLTAAFSARIHNDMAPSAKRAKVDNPDNAERRFSSAVEISQSLRSRDEQGLLGGAVRQAIPIREYHAHLGRY
jgi:hypothetical protein